MYKLVKFMMINDSGKLEDTKFYTVASNEQNENILFKGRFAIYFAGNSILAVHDAKTNDIVQIEITDSHQLELTDKMFKDIGVLDPKVNAYWLPGRLVFDKTEKNNVQN